MITVTTEVYRIKGYRSMWMAITYELNLSVIIAINSILTRPKHVFCIRCAKVFTIKLSLYKHLKNVHASIMIKVISGLPHEVA